MQLILGGALDLDGHMVPLIRRERAACNPSRFPTAAIHVPSVPSMARQRTTLIAEDIIASSVGYIDVKFQAFGDAGILDIKSKIEHKVAGITNRAKISPPQCVGIWFVATYMELRGIAIHRR